MAVQTVNGKENYAADMGESLNYKIKIRRIDSIIFLSSIFYYLSTHRVNSVIFKSR